MGNRTLPSILFMMVAGTGIAYLIHKFWRRQINNSAIKSTLYVCTTCCVGKRTNAETSDKIPTGPDLFRAIVDKFHREASLIGVGAASLDIEKSYEFLTDGGSILRIVPQKCLSSCRQSNCIAFSHPHKYQYHFTMLGAHVEDVEDIVKFANYYTDETGEVFTKKTDRPGKLAVNCISRLPPPTKK